MTVDVLESIPDICRAEFLDCRKRSRTINGRCSRVQKHKGPHFDATIGFAWTDSTVPRLAWRELDAADLTLHFECNDRCPWAPRSC